MISRWNLSAFALSAALFTALAAPTMVSTAALADPNPSPSAQLDMGFLLLPAYELEPMPNPSPRPSNRASDVYLVGDQIKLRVPNVVLPEGSKGPLNFSVPPGTPDLNEQGWEIFSQNDPNEVRLTVVPIKGGSLTLPALAIQDASGKAIARTNPWHAEVQSSISKDDPEPQKPVDLKPPAELAYPWWAVVTLGVLGALFLAALGYGIYRWSQKRRALPVAPAEPPKPEDEVALLALAELDRSGALAKGDFKKHYFRVSEILKTYIGKRYGFDAPENTTREMLENLQRAWDRELIRDAKRLTALQEYFDHLDLVKFTDHVPVLIEAQQISETAREFIRATKKRIEIVPPGGGVNAPR